MERNEPFTELESFAKLLAELHEPFANRAAVLAAAGFESEAAWHREREAWTPRLLAEPGLAAKLGELIQKADREVQQGTLVGAKSSPRFLTKEATTFRDDAARVALEVGSEPAPALTKPRIDEPFAPNAEARDPLEVTMLPFTRIHAELPFAGVSKLSPAVRAAAAKMLVREDTGTLELRDAGPATPATPFEGAKPNPAPPNPETEGPDTAEDPMDRTIEFRRELNKPKGAS